MPSGRTLPGRRGVPHPGRSRRPRRGVRLPRPGDDGGHRQAAPAPKGQGFYDGYLIVVFYALESRDERHQTVEMNFFAGKTYLVTVNSEDVATIAKIAHHPPEQISELDQGGMGLLIYSLLDAVVDDSFPALDDLTERSAALEGAFVKRFDSDEQADIFGPLQGPSCRAPNPKTQARRVDCARTSGFPGLWRGDGHLFPGCPGLHSPGNR